MQEVRLRPEVEAWFLKPCQADPDSADLIAEAIDLLAEQGARVGPTPGGSIEGQHVPPHERVEAGFSRVERNSDDFRF